MKKLSKRQLEKLEEKIFKKATDKKKIRKYYRDTYEDILDELARLVFDTGLVLLFSKKSIEPILDTLAEQFEEELRKRLEEVIVTTSMALTKAGMEKEVIDTIINYNFHGTNFSVRIWKDTARLQRRIYHAVGNMLAQDDFSSSRLKEALMKEFNTSYYNANRLVRTEVSRAFNQATLLTYKRNGVEKVRILVKEDERLCSTCSTYIGKVWDIEEVPQLPEHPNCRCCYMAVI